MKRKQIRLTEEKMREFVSYSVARILKEAMGRSIYDKNGEYDGAVESMYGTESKSIDFDPFEDDDMMAAFESVLNSGKYGRLSKDDFDEYEDGRYGMVFPVKVKVNYEVKQGMKGDYMQPDDPDEVEVTNWELVDNNFPGELNEFVHEVVGAYFDGGYFDTDSLYNDIAGINESARWRRRTR